METGIQGLREGLKQILSEQHAAWRELLTGLSTEAVNWVPGPEMNSLAVLVTHALSAEEFLLATAIGEEIPRDREAEFRTEAPDTTALLRRVDAARERTTALIDRITAEDLATVRARPGRPEQQALGSWWILHAVSHSREHLGHAGMTRQLYEQRHGT